MPDGFSALELGRIAHDTFDDMLRIWYGSPDQQRNPLVSRDEPDVHGIDTRCHIKTVSYRPSSLFFSFQVKALSSPRVSRAIYPGGAYVVPINPRSLEIVVEGDEAPVFLVLGVPRHPLRDLLPRAPAQRFRWFGIELHAYMLHLGHRFPFPSEVHIPLQNELNALVASLLWGSWWTQRSYARINNDVTQSIPGFAALRETFLERSIRTCGTADEISSERDAKNLLEILREIPSLAAHEVRLHLAGGCAVRNIQRELCEAGADRYLSFASEAAREEINLWLFSRLYREHLSWSSERLRSRDGSRYVRFLPMPPESSMPTHLLLAEINAARVHRRHDIAGVLQPVDDVGDVLDRIFLAPNVSFHSRFIDAESGCILRIERGGRVSEDRDFFDEWLRRYSGADALRAAEAAMLARRSLTEADHLPPGTELPLDLFAPVTRLLDHPVELWTERPPV